MSNFLKAYISGMAGMITSGLVCVLSQYAGTCTVNLVLFRQETTELRMHVKSYFVLCFDILTLSTCTPRFLGPHNTLQCVLVVIFYY